MSWQKSNMYTIQMEKCMFVKKLDIGIITGPELAGQRSY